MAFKVEFSSGGRSTKVFCRMCGRQVRSRVGNVCSRVQCHERYLARYERGGR